jgi:xylulokinase
VTKRDAPLIVAIDVGTSGARALAVDLNGEVVAEMRRSIDTNTPQPGWVEQDPKDWEVEAWGALTTLAQNIDHPQRIIGVGLTGQSPTVAPFDKKGRALAPGMLYSDNRATAEALEMRERIGAEWMHRHTGHVADAFHIGPKVLWLRCHAARVFAATRRFLQPRDVVFRQLTGIEATDESHAASTLFFDLRARRWGTDLFAAFDLDPTLFPDALAPWCVAGTLRPSLARELGVSRSLPIVIGAADSQCAAFGVGVFDPGPISEMSGTSSCLNSSVLEPLSDLRVTHYSHVVPGRFSTEVGVNTTGAALDWAIRHLGYAHHIALARAAARFRSQALKSAAAPQDMAPLFLPYMGDGERDDPRLRGAFVGLSMRHDRSALAYAVIEGVALAVRTKVLLLKRAGAPFDELRVSGRGAQLDIAGQLRSDALGQPVILLERDATGVGVAMLAALALGYESEARAGIERAVHQARRFEPDGEWHDVEEERAEWFQQVQDSREVRISPGQS